MAKIYINHGKELVSSPSNGSRFSLDELRGFFGCEVSVFPLPCNLDAVNNGNTCLGFVNYNI